MDAHDDGHQYGHHDGPSARRRPRRDVEPPNSLGPDLALRARDVDRPTADDLAAAERDLTIVRRHWRPDDQH